MDTNSVLVRPIITEKSMKDAKIGKFTFQVHKATNKNEIRKAVESKFSVDVLSVATNITKGRTKRAGKRRSEITLSSWKKAIVKIEQGQKIAMFDLGGNK